MEDIEDHRDELYRKLTQVKTQRDEFLKKGKMVCSKSFFISKTYFKNLQENRREHNTHRLKYDAAQH